MHSSYNPDKFNLIDGRVHPTDLTNKWYVKQENLYKPVKSADLVIGGVRYVISNEPVAPNVVV